MSHFESMYFVGIAVPMIARISEDNFMISGQYRFGEEVFCASFDFHQSLLSQLTNLLPEPALTLAKQSLYHEPFQVDLRAILPHVTIKCKLGIQIEMTRDRKEEFCPLIVTQFV
jgi:hypothetical protein